MSKTNHNRQLNCAIYTRKSTDEGLDKEFNSLDANVSAPKRTSRVRRKKAGTACQIDTTMVASRVATWIGGAQASAGGH